MIDNFLLDLLQGRVEELLEANLTSYAVAVIEDCSKRLDNYVNSEVLAAIQRTASKSWISGTPYAMKACMPDSSILLIDPRKLDKDLVEAILWWSKVLNWSERFGIHLLFILQFCGLFLPFCFSHIKFGSTLIVLLCGCQGTMEALFSIRFFTWKSVVHAGNHFYHQELGRISYNGIWNPSHEMIKITLVSPATCGIFMGLQLFYRFVLAMGYKWGIDVKAISGLWKHVLVGLTWAHGVRSINF